MSSDLDHLRQAIVLAHQAGARGDRPFGAVLVDTRGVVAEGRNAVTTTGDIRAHAELDAITHATQLGHADRVHGATMYASGEPCPMCAAGMVWAGISRIVFAAAEPDFAAVLTNGPRFTLRCVEIIAGSTADIQVEGPYPNLNPLDPFHTFTQQNTP